MAIFRYQANDLFQWLIRQENIAILDVRNSKDFQRFQVEGPYPFEMLNLSYYDFMEIEEEMVAQVPRDREIRIVCAQEGSARYVAEILEKHGFDQVGYLAGGIKSWGNLLVPMLIHGDDRYELYQFIRPGKASCSYGLLCGQELMTFDPSRDLDFYLAFAREKGATITRTFETHLQADYIAGSRAIAAATGASFHANAEDFKGSRNPYTELVDGETFGCPEDGPEIRVLFTPGHTPGSTSFIIDEQFIISGDTIFIDSVGRPDLGGKAEEWAELLYATIQQIKQLDPAIQVLPGHYIDWQEADEKLCFTLALEQVLQRNRGIYEISRLSEFVSFIKDNMRPQPEEYAFIRLVNANLEEPDEERQEELDLGKNECAASTYAQSQRETGP
ncbi:MBL fold metallo-hydrolase [Desulfogranum mediterraneum]|uniref:MBL fold metallo-hydrolase n=1 Tax=Desulfogranum mediterraneum TaxID=160661 RepID=UPI00040A17AA|nr:MBL fold metallo-hydrolase [Desulfogranum mediterraneum]